jgi:hypothetical protein
MKNLFLGAFIALVSLGSMAQVPNDLEGLRCNVPALKKHHTKVKRELQKLHDRLETSIARELKRLKVDYASEGLQIQKKERGFVNNYATLITGRVTSRDGVVINIRGEIQYGQATLEKRYDRIGNYVGKVCEFQAFSFVNLSNAQTKKAISSLRAPNLELNLWQRKTQ